MRYVRRIGRNPHAGLIQLWYDRADELPESNMVFLYREGVLMGSVPAFRFSKFVEEE